MISNRVQPKGKDNLADLQGEFLGSGEHLKNGIWPCSLPLWMAAFYVALFIIRPWEKLFPWLVDLHFERYYVLSMIAVVFFSSKKQVHLSSQSLAVLLFLLAIVLSSVFALYPSLAEGPRYVYFTLVIFYFILVFVIRSPYELAFMVTCYIVTMGVYLAKAQWEFFLHGAHRYDMGVIRMVGIERTFGGPNSLAMSIVVSLPFALFLWSSRKEFTSGWPSFWKKWFPRCLGIYMVLAVSSIILTNSRSGMVSFILFVLLAAFKGRGLGRKLGYTLLGILMLAVIWQVLPQAKRNRFQTIWNPEAGPTTAYSSAMGRIEGLKAGMTMFERYPLSGVGIGNFILYRVHHVDGVPLNAHNLVGQVLGETGLVGSATFLLLVMVTLANCRKTNIMAQRHCDPTLTALPNLTLACRNAIILLVFEGLFSHNLLRFNWLWLAAFTVLALQFVRQKVHEKSPEEPPRRNAERTFS